MADNVDVTFDLPPEPEPASQPSRAPTPKPVRRPDVGGVSTLTWLAKEWPDVYGELMRSPEHAAANAKDVKSAKEAKRRPAISGRFPSRRA